MFRIRITDKPAHVDTVRLLPIYKKILNNAKRVISYVSNSRWSTVTAWFELSKFVVQRCRGRFDIPADASNAFFKLIELSHLIDVSSFKTPIRLFDNASLPGDFIRAYCYRFPQQIDWMANSLLTGLDDRFGLRKDFPTRWVMDNDMNGDVTKSNNIAEICNILEKRGFYPDLYTSDLGVAFNDRYNEETLHMKAHTAQIALGLSILSNGGGMIIKMFNIFEPSSHAIIELLCSVFESLEIVKPSVSKTDNSECYLVATGYTRDATVTKKFCDKVENYTDDPIIPPSYLHDVVIAAVVLTTLQTRRIIRNVQDFDNHVRHDYNAEAGNWIRTFIAKL